jgi:hypothetical protein
VTEFVVLAKDDGSRSVLLAADQAPLAREHGYTTVEFTAVARTRGLARDAWDRHRGSQQPGDAETITNEWGLESLTDAQRAAVVGIVRALVQEDRGALEAVGAYEYGDPFEWTRRYGTMGQVHLIMPPGDSRHWGGAVDMDEGDTRWAGVDVDMWTEQEGPSDLSLQVELQDGPGDEIELTFRSLHVL